MAILSIKNEYGKILIGRDILSSIIQAAVFSMNGYFVLSDRKGKLYDVRGFLKAGSKKSIGIERTSQGLSVRVYLVAGHDEGLSSNLNILAKKIEDDLAFYSNEHVKQVCLIIVKIRSKIVVKNHYKKLVSLVR